MTAPTIAERLAAVEEWMREAVESAHPAELVAWADELAAIRAEVEAICQRIEAAPSKVAAQLETTGVSREHVWHPDYDEEQGRIVESCFNCGVSRECWPNPRLAPEKP